MPATDAMAQKPDTSTIEDPDQADAVAEGPSVAAHPRASLHVARAKGWAGLAGFLVAGYLSLPTSTVAVAGLRALIGGVVCYVVAWAGAVFVWRHLMMLQIAGARARERQRESALAAASRAGGNVPHQRANVRVAAQRPVTAYVGAQRTPVQTFTIDISAGGLQVSGLADLQKGEPFEFELTLAPGEPPVKGTGTVVRTDPKGRCAISFTSITREAESRLDHFVFDYLRSERQDQR